MVIPTMDFKDYYKILGVEPTADDKAIKAAYRKLARKYHPDVSKEKDAEAKFKDASEAYEALKSADKRAEYDDLRRYGQHGQPFQGPPGWQSRGGFGGGGQDTGDFSDFFSSIFGNRGPGFGGAESRRAAGAEDRTWKWNWRFFWKKPSRTNRRRSPSRCRSTTPPASTSATPLKV
jgi:curved DNA-binding protein